jgi:hypothetical protein
MPSTSGKGEKMRSKKIMILGCALALCASLSFSSEQDNALIKEVQVRDNGMVIVIMTTERNTDTVSCINSTYHKTHWAFNPSTASRYGEFLATLLTAKSMSSPVRITGTGTCNAFATIETLQTITVK